MNETNKLYGSLQGDESMERNSAGRTGEEYGASVRDWCSGKGRSLCRGAVRCVGTVLLAEEPASAMPLWEGICEVASWVWGEQG